MRPCSCARSEATVTFVMNRMRQLGYQNEHTLAYQSKVGPVEWLKPYTDDKIRELAGNGVDSLMEVTDDDLMGYGVPKLTARKIVRKLLSAAPPYRRVSGEPQPLTFAIAIAIAIATVISIGAPASSTRSGSCIHYRSRNRSAAVPRP